MSNLLTETFNKIIKIITIQIKRLDNLKMKETNKSFKTMMILFIN